MQREILVIFDYSGTLSLEAPLYASPENLPGQLEITGLKKIGIISPVIFWEEIVNPTWREGSTTPAGYKQVMKARIDDLLLKNSTAVDDAMISQAVSLFVDNYLSRSLIDRRWQPIFSKLKDSRYNQVIIATDHYAEATDTIIKYLNNWNIPALSAKDAFKTHSKTPFIVANSADLGSHKSDRPFWKFLKDGLATDHYQKILLIDDFGYNEQKEDYYRRQQDVERRKKATIQMIEEIFSGKIVTIPFIIEASPEAALVMNSTDKGECFGLLIEQTSLIIEKYISN